MSKNLFDPTIEQLVDAHLDITGGTDVKEVEVVLKGDNSVLWVNINGICVFRACRVRVTLNDMAESQDPIILRG